MGGGGFGGGGEFNSQGMGRGLGRGFGRGFGGFNGNGMQGGFGNRFGASGRDGFDINGSPTFKKGGTIWEGGQFALLIMVLIAPNLPDAKELTDFAGVLYMMAGCALIYDSTTGPPRAPNELRTNGAYRLCRHPLYGGLVITAVGVSVLSSSPERIVATLFLYLLLSYKAKEEERVLEDEWGRAYYEWADKVPRLIPDVSKPRRVVDVVDLALTEARAGSHDRNMMEDFILDQTARESLVLFTEEGNSDCKKAIDMLKDAGATPSIVTLEDSQGDMKRAALGRLTGTMRVPSCWIGGKYFGSYDDGPTPQSPGLVKLSFQDRLKYELELAGAIPYSPDRFSGGRYPTGGPGGPGPYGPGPRDDFGQRPGGFNNGPPRSNSYEPNFSNSLRRDQVN